MELKRWENNFTVCKVEDFSGVDMNREFVFVGKTDEEIRNILINDFTKHISL